MAAPARRSVRRRTRALSFLLLGPLFFWFAPDVTRRDLVDFVGQKVG
jgi:hypothetical protein